MEELEEILESDCDTPLFWDGGEICRRLIADCVESERPVVIITTGRLRRENKGVLTFVNLESRVYSFFWSKPGEHYPKGRMNGDNMCRLCLNVPRISRNPKYCSGCLKNGIHTKFKQYEANPYVRNLE